MYDPVLFWEAHAPHLAGPGAASLEHERQEAALEKLLRPLKWQSVLEVGVGGGRVTDLLRRIRPEAEYTGIDIGETQLDNGRRVWPEGTFESSPVQSFKAGDRQWDLVIASEVLMHVKPAAIKKAIANVLAASRRHVVLVEWDPTPEELAAPIADWNFPHDYRALLADARIASETKTDRQTIWHVKV